MGQVLNWILCILALAVGIFLTVKPEKATFGGDPTKKSILIMRSIGIVILALFVFAAFAFFMALKEGQLTL